MSRRITFFALAVSATLIATQASADRECFEDSCRHFEVAEPALPPAAPPAATYRPRRAAAPAIVAGPGAVYAEDDVVRVYPNPRHDPAWKICQLDRRESDQRRCGAYSYHPYGANGYRPYGNYADGRGAQIYMIAPNAKIISIDSDD